jgi:hypothetical protein
MRTGIAVGAFSAECPSEMEMLELTALPCWAGLTAHERSRMVRELVAKIDATAPNPTNHGTSHITAQDPRNAPLQTKQTPRPKAHASTMLRWIEGVRRYMDFLSAFRCASRRWMAGNFDTEFPLHSFRPPPWIVAARNV